MKKRLFGALMMLMVLILVTACNNGEAPSGEVVDGTTEQSVLPTYDPAGNPISIPDNVETIVSLAPSITQVLEDLGVKDKLVAVDFVSADITEGLDNLPQLDMMAPDLEVLLSLDPDIIFASGISFFSGEDVFQVLIDAGVTVIHIPTSESIEAIKADNQFIADSLQLSAKGEALNNEMQSIIDEINKIGTTISEPKTVLFEISPLPDIFSFGANVFLNEMIEIVGAVNVFADQESWLPVTEEAAVGTNPDVILTNVNFIDNPVDEILNRSGWTGVTAIENEAVHYIDNFSSSYANHRIVLALKQMALAIYPEEFASIRE